RKETSLGALLVRAPDDAFKAFLFCKGTTDTLQEVAHIEGLEYVPINKRGILLCFLSRGMPGGQHDHPGLSRARSLPYALENRPAVHGRHDDVKENEAWPFSVEVCEALVATIGCMDDVPLHLEDGPEEINEPAVIVNDENGPVHCAFHSPPSYPPEIVCTVGSSQGFTPPRFRAPARVNLLSEPCS